MCDFLAHNSAWFARRFAICWGLLFLLAVALGCSSQPAAELGEGENGEVYRPPAGAPQTPLVLPLPSPSSTASKFEEPAAPTPTPTCFDDLRFAKDLSIPDGALVSPGELIDKRWEVENAGTCNWDRRYSLRLIQGSGMGAPDIIALYPARGGTQAMVQILFTAPGEPGTYRSAWQVFNPGGEPFGDMIYVEVVVVGSG